MLVIFKNYSNVWGVRYLWKKIVIEKIVIENIECKRLRIFSLCFSASLETQRRNGKDGTST